MYIGLPPSILRMRRSRLVCHSEYVGSSFEAFAVYREQNSVLLLLYSIHTYGEAFFLTTSWEIEVRAFIWIAKAWVQGTLPSSDFLRVDH
jgi:hypothetical protein